MKVRNLFILLLLICVSGLAFGQDKKTGTTSTKHVATKSKTTIKVVPARDPKTGRFMKKTDVHVAVKAGPARDPKTGRFIKKNVGAEANSTKTTSGPARDPKTGRFIKKNPTAVISTSKHAVAATSKTMPARDPKTGKFTKKGKGTDKKKGG
jgi:hypothetical protein